MKPFHKTNPAILAIVASVGVLPNTNMLTGSVFAETMLIASTDIPHDRRESIDAYYDLLDTFLESASTSYGGIIQMSELTADGINVLLGENLGLKLEDLDTGFLAEAFGKMAERIKAISQIDRTDKLPKTTALLESIKALDLTGPASDTAKTGANRGQTNDADHAKRSQLSEDIGSSASDRSSPGFQQTKGSEVAGEGDRQVA